MQVEEAKYFITWIESDKAEIIEEMLDDRNIPIGMRPTPDAIRNQADYVMVCKDCFELYLSIDEVLDLKDLDFPKETRCFHLDGSLVWEKNK